MNFRNFKFKLPKGSEGDRISRVVYITAVCLLLGIVVLAAFTTAANRARKPALTTPTVDETTRAPGTTTPGTDKVPEDTGVGESVPTFALPVDGSLGMSHDPDLQVKNLTTGDWRVHMGIDIICAEGAPVYASADGTVSQVFEDPMMGYTIVIKHASGYSTVYKNLSPTHATGIAEGNSVYAGQLLGTVGDSALLELAEEAHLHFEIHLDGEQLDPLDCLTASALSRLEGADSVID